MPLAANAFGTSFNVKFSKEETQISATGIMNGNNSQGNLPLGYKRFANKPKPIIFTQTGGYFIAIIDTNADISIEPYVSDKLVTNKEIFDELNPIFVVNAGFFDTANGKTVSYIVKNFETIVSPKDNENLCSNPTLATHLDKVFNRSEFRILQKGRKVKYDIAKHNSPPPNGWKIRHSIQGGPALLPENTAEEEFFITYDETKKYLLRDAISVTKKAPRTAIGIREDKIFIIIAPRENPVTLESLAYFCKSIGIKKLLNFDGGGSTSFNATGVHIASEKDGTQRKVKSFLIVKPNKD